MSYNATEITNKEKRDFVIPIDIHTGYLMSRKKKSKILLKTEDEICLREYGKTTECFYIRKLQNFF